MQELEKEFQSVVDQFFRTKFYSSALPQNIWYPQADVYENTHGLVVKIELAGIDPQRIQVIVESQTLIIQGVRPETTRDKKSLYYQLEISYGPFRRIIALPFAITAAEAKTNYQAGFLEIELPHNGKSAAGLKVIEMNNF